MYGTDSIIWLISGIIILSIPTLLVIAIAWKMKDIDSAYSESSCWIFLGLLAQVQIIFLAIPKLVIVGQHSTNVKYIGFVLFLFSFPMVLQNIIMIPKYLAVWKASHPEQSTRGQHVAGSCGDWYDCHHPKSAHDTRGFG
jgi:hypothetical protein